MANITNSYETVMILSMNLGEEGINGLVTKFKDLIAANGTVEGVDEWGKRKLAYPIQKQPEGYYVLIDFKSAADFTAELDRIYKITDGVLRSLIIKKEEKPAKAKKVVKKAAEATEA
jgi:small subunit ribosomal protein S6